MKIFRITTDRFRLVYWVIAIATAQHTAWGAATTMQGTQSINDWFWWAQGIAFAIAIDMSMVMIAEKIRSGLSKSQRAFAIWKFAIWVNWYVIAFILVGLISFYFQLLYTWNHADALTIGTGITTDWQLRLQHLIDARIIITPLALPAIAILYTIAGLGKGGETQSRNQVAKSQPQSPYNPDAIVVEKPQLRRLPQPRSTLLALPAPTAITDEKGKVHGWVCPGCDKELSISGWSRHKHTCNQYLSLGQ